MTPIKQEINMTTDKNSSYLSNNFIIAEGKKGRVFKIREYIVKKFKPEINDNGYVNSIHNEAYILYKLKTLIEDGITPNFAYMIKTNIKYLPLKYHPDDNYYILKNKPYIKLCNYDTTLRHFIKTCDNYKIYKSILIQLIFAIKTFQYHLSGYHGDLQLSNIFIKSIDKNAIYEYIYDKKSYICPTYGYLVVIGDFGLSKINKPIIKTDFKYLYRLPYYISYDYNKNPYNIDRYKSNLRYTEIVSLISILPNNKERMELDIEREIREVQRYDKERNINRHIRIYMFMIKKGYYIPKHTKKIIKLCDKLEKFMEEINLTPDVINADDIKLKATSNYTNAETTHKFIIS